MTESGFPRPPPALSPQGPTPSNDQGSIRLLFLCGSTVPERFTSSFMGGREGAEDLAEGPGLEKMGITSSQS